MSFGVTDARTAGRTVRGMLHSADVALYDAKRKGRNRVVTADGQRASGPGRGHRPVRRRRPPLTFATLRRWPRSLVTFDNLGEAAELERGTWPRMSRWGSTHVREALPELLSLLAREDLRATFFLEGLNGQLYPEALQGLRAAGTGSPATAGAAPWHEVSDEAERLARARDALGGPIGFRPRPAGD